MTFLNELSLLNEKESALVEAILHQPAEDIEDAVFEEFDNFPFDDMADEGDTVNEDYNIIDDGEVVENDILLYNPADIMCEKKEAHRCKLKLGPIPYMVSWMNGFTNSPNIYKRGSRLYKAYLAGKRASE
jgi:hypothetical protein